MSLRRRVLLLTLTLLLLLDVARSVYARLGAATPAQLLSPDLSYARPIAWPPGSDLAADAPRGQRVYAEHCAVCHGPDGHGNGPAAPSLNPRPRDFTSAVFKLKSTPSGQPPTLADVTATIKRGMPGTSMPGWHDILSDTDTEAVADYVRSLGPLQAWAPPDDAPTRTDTLMAGASAERGRSLYVDLGCPACHGAAGGGDGPSAKDLKDVWKQPVQPRDLTAPWSFRGGNSPAALYARIANGQSGTPMPGYAEVAEPAQIADVVAYVLSIARPAPWQPGGTLDGTSTPVDAAKRGEYLVRAGMCGLCHTPVDTHGIYLANTHYLAGGMKVTAGAHGIFFAPNLTPDTDTGLGKWTAEEIALAIRTGHTAARRLNYWGMPWMVFGALTPDDAAAIATYLQTLPPVRNQIPLPLHYGLIETVARKLTYAWPVLMPPRLAYYAGNFGSAQPTWLGRDLPQRLLIWAQFLVIGLGALLLWLLRISSPPEQERSLGLGFLKLMMLTACVAAVSIVYRYPAVNLLPASTVVTAFSAGLPEVNESAPQETALVQRGRYLYSFASCQYCHGSNGAGGGKLNWSVFGTTWASNLTAHPTGMADWSDEAVLRALTSGVSRDGRALHWQAMIWDHISNYTLADLHTLLAYIRSLPPIDRTLPQPVAPRAEDCAGDTFWVGTTDFEAGCR